MPLGEGHGLRGGGRIGGYTKKLSEHLGILAERVAVRGEEVMGKIRFKEENVRKDSLMVTPIGICLNYYEQSNNFIYVSFNEEHIKIYDSGNLAVVDAAMHANFPNDGLFPRRGKEINYTINGKKSFKRGNLGEAARITVNGEAADMHSPIRANDVIQVEPSTVGTPAKLTIAELPEFKSMIVIRANDSRILLPRVAVVNGEEQNEFYEVQEGDEIVMRDYYTVAQVRRFMDVLLDDKTEVLVNNEPADDDTKVYENFTIKWGLKADKAKQEQAKRKAKQEEAAAEEELSEEMPEEAEEDEEPAADSFEALPEDDGTYVRQEKETEEAPAKEEPRITRSISLTVNGKEVRLEGKPEYVFVDVFDHIDFDLQKVKGTRLITDLNGHKAEYMEPVHSGDVIVIRWED